MLRLNDQADGLRRNASEPSNVVRLRRPTGTHTRTIAVTSGKGGVGKTQISANLGVALARRGLRVVLLDADLGLASLDLALGLSPTHDIRSVMEGQMTLDEVLVEGPAGVKLVPACPGRYDMANLGTRELNALHNAVDELAKSYDVLVIDTGAGIGSNAVSFASSADDVLLVSTPDPTSMRDAYAMAKVLNRRSGVDRLHLITNQVASETEGGQLFARLDGIVRRFLTLDMSYLGCVPRDEAVRQSVAAGEPYVMRAPDSSAAQATDLLARRLFADRTSRELC